LFVFHEILAPSFLFSLSLSKGDLIVPLFLVKKQGKRKGKKKEKSSRATLTFKKRIRMNGEKKENSLRTLSSPPLLSRCCCCSRFSSSR